MTQWIQGGPFLEVSFMLESNDNNIQEIINTLFSLPTQIEFIHNDIDEKIRLFVEGYPFDEDDSSSVYLHSLELKLYVQISRKHKALLQIDRVSSNTIMMNFLFSGSSIDASEWNQIGMNDYEIAKLSTFLKELYDQYDFIVGGIALERDILDFFNCCNETYPNECFRLEKLDFNQAVEHSVHFIDVIYNEKYKK